MGGKLSLIFLTTKIREGMRFPRGVVGFHTNVAQFQRGVGQFRKRWAVSSESVVSFHTNVVQFQTRRWAVSTRRWELSHKRCVFLFYSNKKRPQHNNLCGRFLLLFYSFLCECFSAFSCLNINAMVFIFFCNGFLKLIHHFIRFVFS